MGIRTFAAAGKRVTAKKCSALLERVEMRVGNEWERAGGCGMMERKVVRMMF